MRGRWTGTYSWPMSVGLRDADGLLLAVVVAVIDADSFTPLQQAADLGDDAMMELFRSDGALLLRQPMLGMTFMPWWDCPPHKSKVVGAAVPRFCQDRNN